MADAVVSLVLKRLASLIAERVQSEVNLVIHPKEEVQKLVEILNEIQKVLKDAEKQGVTNNEVQRWLKVLEDVSYDIDDTLDEREFKNLALQIEALTEGSPQDLGETVSSFLESLCLCFNEVLERRRILLNVKGLHKRLDEIAKMGKREYNFLPNLGSVDDTPTFNRYDSHHIIDVSEVHGRDSDKERLLNLMFRSDQGVQIISVEGAGGMAKTTLAQLVFNDPKVHFEKKIWVCVSDPFDEFKVVRKILKVTAPNFDGSERDYDMLLERVKASILGKKFLLVLDDVWTEDDTRWKPLRISLKSGACGSVILVTTRSEKVSRAMGTNQRHALVKLSDSDCWAIMRQRAFQGRSDCDCVKFEVIGEKIAEKCKGLALAAKTLGGFLRVKNTVDEWNAILRSEIWELKIAEMFPHFYLSYNELPPETKRCFSYCVVFPKDEEIDVNDLIRIWMAQGLLSSTGNVEMELQGREYFEDLAMRSFFQDFEKDEFGELIVSCKMHDIVHDFAQFTRKHESLVVESRDGMLSTRNENVRHLYWKNTGENFDIPCSYFLFNGLHSLFSFARFDINLVHHLTKVRILSLTRCEITKIPAEMGSLTHLRYLNLSGNPIKELPPALFKLYNLQSLFLSWCELIQKIPKEIGNLIYLRYLDLRGCVGLKELPETLCELRDLRTLNISCCLALIGLPLGISKLTKLQNIFNKRSVEQFPQELEKLTNLHNLSCLAVGENKTKPRCLKNLNQLGGSLYLSIWGITEKSEAKKIALQNKTNLRNLNMFYMDMTCVPFSEDAMEALQPPRELHSFTIHYGGPLPGWIISLTNLRILEIMNCSNKCLPPLRKLPLLEKLDIKWLEDLAHLGAEFLGITKKDLVSKKATLSAQVAFPKLKSLYFGRCPNWRVWEDIEDEEENALKSVVIMPCLEQLEIHNCQALEELPSRLLCMTSSLKVVWVDSKLADYFERKIGRRDVLVRPL